jgi:hypothetical protein
VSESIDRLQKSPLALLAQASGGPRAMAAKAGRLFSALLAYARPGEAERRLDRLRDAGMIDVKPTRVQMFVGGFDMLRFFISPAAADYYRSKNISFAFHQVLRILDEPASMVDPTGFFSTRDNIIGHVMQVVHANPRYDLQLLEAHERGLEELESQVEAMIRGEHPRSESIRAVVEDPEYHARLLEYVRAYRADRDALPPVRENIGGRFEAEEQTFGTLPSALAYFSALPTSLTGALMHFVRVRRFADAPAAA